jgi:hypothetical protein
METPSGKSAVNNPYLPASHWYNPISSMVCAEIIKNKLVLARLSFFVKA